MALVLSMLMLWAVPAYADQPTSTTSTITLSPAGPVTEGTLVTITATTVVQADGTPVPTPINNNGNSQGKIQIQQLVSGVWTVVDQGTPSAGQFSTTFDTTGLGGQTLSFRAHYVPQGSGYGESASDPANLVVNSSVVVVTQQDTTPPTTTITLDPPSPNGNNGWYVTDVHVTVSATDDGGSGVNETRSVLDPAIPPATFDDIPVGNPYGGAGANVTADGQHIVYAASIDNDGNKETPVNATFKIDQTPPEVSITGPSVVLQYYAFATATVTASDATSGLFSDPSGSLTLDTSTVGSHTVTVTAEDNAGNTANASLTYTVWGVIGPFAPLVKNGQGVGQFKAGSTIPVKFQLTDGTNLISTAQGTVTIGSTSAPFRWDATALQYIANVKTDKTPATGVPVVLSVTGVVGTTNLATINLR
jgi:hypothetical protein